MTLLSIMYFLRQSIVTTLVCRLKAEGKQTKASGIYKTKKPHYQHPADLGGFIKTDVETP